MTAPPAETKPDRRKYMRIADKIRDDIVDGKLAVGDKLPPETVLAPRFKAAKLTLRRALNLLRMEGYVDTTQGIGTYVRSADPGGDVNPQEHFNLTLMMIDDARDALDRLEAHLHKTVNTRVNV